MKREWSPKLVALVVAAVCLICYLRALSCKFLNFDDQDFVVNNTYLRALDWNLVKWSFTSVASISGSWIPLSWLSFALDYRLWGLNPAGFHLTNILLHGVNAALVVLIADRIYRLRVTELPQEVHPKYYYPAMLLLAGLIFGLHPLRVEAVVWVTERRGVLNGVFALLSIYYYLDYAARMKTEGKSGAARRAYLLSLATLVISLLAKPSSVVMPALMLVLDWYPLKRLEKPALLGVIREKVPFFLVAGVMTVATVYLGAQDGGLQAGAAGLSFWQKIVLSGNALFEYVRLTLWPFGILPLKIIATPIPFTYTIKAIIAFLCCVVVALLWKRRWLTATFLGFLLPILPVLTFFQMNDVVYAARYTYLPAVALSIAAPPLIVRGYEACADRGPQLRYLFVAAVAGCLLFYAGMTQFLIGTWQDSGTLWSRVIAFQPHDRAYFLRALYYVDAGQYRSAIDDYTSCLDIAEKERLPENYVVNIIAFRGEAYERAGRYQEAVADFSAAIRMNPHPLYYYHRGRALMALGRSAEAASDLARAGSAKGQMFWISP